MSAFPLAADRVAEIELTFAAVPLLSRLNDRQRRQLARRATTRSYRPEAVIVRQGDTSMAFYVVLSGWIRIERESETGTPFQVWEAGPAGFFGETGLIDDEPRAPTVVSPVRFRPSPSLSTAFRHAPTVRWQVDCQLETRELLVRERLSLEETCGRASQSPRTWAGLRRAAEAIGIAPDGWSVPSRPRRARAGPRHLPPVPRILVLRPTHGWTARLRCGIPRNRRVPHHARRTPPRRRQSAPRRFAECGKLAPDPRGGGHISGDLDRTARRTA